MTEKVALITGGTSGIGLATTHKFLTEGYKVYAVGMDTQDFDDVKKQENSNKLVVQELDVTDADAVQKMVTDIVKQDDRLDVLDNNAGILAKHQDLVDADLQDIERTINVNLMGSIIVAKYAGQVMKKQGSGTIVNIGSIDGVMANHESIAYHASKGGIHMFTKALARELSPFGVRVLAVAPGWVETEMVPPKMKAFGESLLMTHKLISPAELANVVYLMTLPEAKAINGSVVMADDGYASFKGTEIAGKVE